MNKTTDSQTTKDFERLGWELKNYPIPIFDVPPPENYFMSHEYMLLESMKIYDWPWRELANK